MSELDLTFKIILINTEQQNVIGHKITRQTFILKKVTLVNRSTEDFKSTSFSALDDGKFV